MKGREIHEALDELTVGIYLLEIVQKEKLEELLAKTWMITRKLKDDILGNARVDGSESIGAFENI